jgi:hypothetical protein
MAGGGVVSSCIKGGFHERQYAGRRGEPGRAGALPGRSRESDAVATGARLAGIVKWRRHLLITNGRDGDAVSMVSMVSMVSRRWTMTLMVMTVSTLGTREDI